MAAGYLAGSLAGSLAGMSLGLAALGLHLCPDLRELPHWRLRLSAPHVHMATCPHVHMTT